MLRTGSPARFLPVVFAAVIVWGSAPAFTQAPAGPTFGPINAYHVWDGHPAYWDSNLAPAHGAAADFDKDGDNDVLITDGSQPTALRYMRNNGAGAFAPTRIEVSGPCPGATCMTNSNRVRAADVNNDGRMDAIVSNNHSANVSVLINTGLNGSGIPVFAPKYYPVPSNGRAVNVGDLNGDGTLDLIAGNADWNVYVFLNNGDGTFGSGTAFADGGNNHLDIAVADLNGDTRNDVIVGNRDGVPGGDISVFLGNGAGGLIPAGRYQGSNGGSLALADFDGDGNVDVAANATTSPTSAVALFKGLGNGALAAAVFIPTGTASATFVATADFDADGKHDLAVSDNAGHRVAVLRGNGNGTFGPSSLHPTPVATSLRSPYQVLTADLNKDGKPDLATVNHTSDNLAVMLNTSLPSDTTAPVVTPAVTGTLVNGWYTSNVTVSWAIADPESSFTSSGCSVESVTSDTAGTTFTCTATSAGGTTTERVTIKRDATGPSIASATADPSVLWAPNNKMRAVTVSVSASDAGSGAVVCTISGVGSSEGGSAHEPDVELTGPLTMNLRAEREGKGTGRTYTAQIACKDAAGNTSATSAAVTVPHDQRK